MSTCPECSGDVVHDEETGELICTICGLVVGYKEKESRRPDSQVFTLAQKKRVRYGPGRNPMIYDHGLSTDIKYYDVKHDSEFLRYRKLDQRTKVDESKARNLTWALSDINRIVEKLGRKQLVKRKAAEIYRKALDGDLIRGRTIDGIAAASVYMACRVLDNPTTLTAIADASGIKKKDLARLYRFLYDTLDYDPPNPSVLGYITKYGETLSLDEGVLQVAAIYLDKASKKKLTIGRGPQGMAGACLYLACKDTDTFCTQKRISEVAKVTEVTIRNRYKELEEELNKPS